MKFYEHDSYFVLYILMVTDYKFEGKVSFFKHFDECFWHWLTKRKEGTDQSFIVL